MNMRKLAVLATALVMTLTACGDTGDDSKSPTSMTASSTVPTSAKENTTSETTLSESIAGTTTEATPSTPTELIPETVQEQIDEAATVGRGPRPPLSEMVMVDGFGYVGIYITDDGMEHYICDARGYPSMDIMGEDGCSRPMGWEEAYAEFEASLTRRFEG